MLYCIVGPSGCGKSTVVSKLNSLGYTSPDSYTTRPRRYPNEGGHTYITKEEYDNLEDKVAYTTFNGYEYCVTRQMLDGCDLYIVDPSGIEALKYNGYTDFKVIGLNLEASDCAVRMLARGDNSNDVLGRLENDWYIFRNFESMCDYIIDATLDLQEIIDKVITYITQTN